MFSVTCASFTALAFVLGVSEYSRVYGMDSDQKKQEIETDSSPKGIRLAYVFNSW